MAVKRKAAVETKNSVTVLDMVVAHVTELWARHSKEIQEIRERSEGQEITVTFKCDLDYSEGQPLIEVQMRYAETHTDKITSRLDDPDWAAERDNKVNPAQERLIPATPEQFAKPKRGRGRPRKTATERVFDEVHAAIPANAEVRG